MKNAVLVILSIILLAVGVGCTAVSKLATPATIDKQAVVYAAKAKVVDANDFKGWANLDKAERLALAVDNAYEVNSLELQQLAQKNQLDYDHLKGTTTVNLQVAQAREESLFGEKGLMSVGLTALGFGGFTGLLGLMRKRPGDMTPAEVESAVSQVTYDKTAKERQMGEVVRGVQDFIEDAKKMSFEELMAGFKDGNIGDVLKSYLKNQSPDTKQAVASIKATA